MQNSSKNLYKKLLGIKGEDKAVKFLKKQGYNIIQRNYRLKFAEADIIAIKNNVLTFIEVKTRSGNTFGTPAEAVDYKKQEKYRMLASFYINENSYEGEISFAVVEILKNNINLIENAF